ncbi:hypothetical protein [Sciscionella marina]|nr:hypothetical protein [Sciscionella marina]
MTNTETGGTAASLAKPTGVMTELAGSPLSTAASLAKPVGVSEEDS